MSDMRTTHSTAKSPGSLWCTLSPPRAPSVHSPISVLPRPSPKPRTPHPFSWHQTSGNEPPSGRPGPAFTDLIALAIKRNHSSSTTASAGSSSRDVMTTALATTGTGTALLTPEFPLEVALLLAELLLLDTLTPGRTKAAALPGRHHGYHRRPFLRLAASREPPNPSSSSRAHLLSSSALCAAFIRSITACVRAPKVRIRWFGLMAPLHLTLAAVHLPTRPFVRAHPRSRSAATLSLPCAAWEILKLVAIVVSLVTTVGAHYLVMLTGTTSCRLSSCRRPLRWCSTMNY